MTQPEDTTFYVIQNDEPTVPIVEEESAVIFIFKNVIPVGYLQGIKLTTAELVGRSEQTCSPQAAVAENRNEMDPHSRQLLSQEPYQFSSNQCLDEKYESSQKHICLEVNRNRKRPRSSDFWKNPPKDFPQNVYWGNPNGDSCEQKRCLKKELVDLYQKLREMYRAKYGKEWVHLEPSPDQNKSRQTIRGERQEDRISSVLNTQEADPVCSPEQFMEYE
ncbi:hypothetical protein LSH36_3g00036 [Paralvinella palmiformis]|uniref:Uncharacterized protein n=1 Tax=Paralvinella palmiformis TaxID=53620 RepID=A0AAD9KFJ7_9ANNE|nr:hypothetical protein LSH36_3g00036 [Paralvinella palmiformis]